MKKTMLLTVMAACGLATAWAQPCACDEALEEVMGRVEETYLGHYFLENPQDYQAHQSRYQSLAAAIPEDSCVAFLQDFLDYFDDGHLFVFESPQYSEVELASFAQRQKSTAPDLDSLKAWLSETPADPMTGLWQDSQSTLAVVRQAGHYRAYIISSKLAAVKVPELKATWHVEGANLEGTYYSYGHAPRHVWGGLYKANTQLVWTGAMVWTKLQKANAFPPPAPTVPPAWPSLQDLGDSTTLFTIPSFLVHPDTFNRILLDQLPLLFATRRLIIDIRGNVGGNALYFAFLDAFANRPLPPSQGWVLASEPTLRYFEQMAGQSEVYAPVVEAIRAHIGEQIPGPQYPGRTFSSPGMAISEVAILMDRGCMSASESFVLHALAVSDRITTFGEPTAGVIDYTSVNSLSVSSGGSRNIFFGYPTSTWNQQVPQEGYNRTGIVPEVPLSTDEPDPIRAILDYYQSKEASP